MFLLASTSARSVPLKLNNRKNLDSVKTGDQNRIAAQPAAAHDRGLPVRQNIEEKRILFLERRELLRRAGERNPPDVGSVVLKIVNEE